MVKLYFGKPETTVTTILLLGFLAFSVFLFFKRTLVPHWGRLTLLAVFWGLLLCCTAAMRDGYHLSIQNSIDKSVSPGLFQAVGIQTIVGGILALAAVLCAILSIFLKSQDTREILFFILCGSLMIKAAFMEVSRIVLFFSTSSTWIFK